MKNTHKGIIIGTLIDVIIAMGLGFGLLFGNITEKKQNKNP